MSLEFYLFLQPDKNNPVNVDSSEVSWVYRDVNQDLKLVQGSLKDAAGACLSSPVTVVIPGEDALYLVAEIPGKSLQQIQQAVPYALEESVIDDVDNLHFAVAKSENVLASNEKNNLYHVSVINKQYFESIISLLERSGIHANEIIPDYFLLNPKELFINDKRILFNGGKLKFAALVDDEFNLDRFNFDAGDISKLTCFEKSESVEKKLSSLAERFEAEIEQSDSHPFLYLIKNKTSSQKVNLLQGLYKKKKNWSKTGKAWFPAAALLLIWLSIQSVVFVIDYVSVSNQSAALNSKILQIYKNTFPASRRTDNPRARMESQLLSLRKQKGQSGRSFTEMLSQSAEVFSKTQGLKIKSLRYYDGRINIEMQIANLQALDKLKAQLVQEKGYQVDIQNASSGQDTVTAQIQIMGAAI